MSEQGITFEAIFSAARTTVDGGWKITLDVNADDSKAMLQLAQMRDTLFQVAMIPIEERGFGDE